MNHGRAELRLSDHIQHVCVCAVLADSVYALYVFMYTAHNQSYKAHRNGIKKPQRNKYASLKGVRLCTHVHLCYNAFMYMR